MPVIKNDDAIDETNQETATYPTECPLDDLAFYDPDFPLMDQAPLTVPSLYHHHFSGHRCCMLVTQSLPPPPCSIPSYCAYDPHGSISLNPSLLCSLRAHNVL